MKRPIIGISPSFEEDKYYKLCKNYCELVNEAGGEAIILPFQFETFSALDGVILSGGGDVDGQLGGYENTEIVDRVAHERDAFEVRLFEAAFRRGAPILGICRGHQIINVALKGTLHRDIDEAGFTENHQLHGESEHPIRTLAPSRVREMFGETAMVWSTHHQAVKDLGKGLTATAWSPEGIIEAIEHENGRVIGLQTHPERMGFLPPFLWLVENCGK